MDESFSESKVLSDWYGKEAGIRSWFRVHSGGELKGYFFHASAVKNAEFDSIQVGDTVEYEMQVLEQGPKATYVSLIGG